MPPISVLIPTRNCAALVPGHLESLRSWMDLAEEVVVVDSDSRDGTVELLRAGISHPCVRFLNHPPGLYQSWNFGIQNLHAKYTYIATVGDSIERHGVEHLLDVAGQFQSDAVISKPRFVAAGGEPLPDSHWPIDEILERLHIRKPHLLSPSEQFLLAVTNTWGAILGSSASNLYRTECLQRRPFPTEFGTAGDGGWGILNVFEVKIAVTPARFSTFRHHEKAYSLSDYHVASLALKLFRLAQTVIEQQRPRNPLVGQILDEVRWPELERELDTSFVEQDKLESSRGGKVPWFLQPGAWKARLTRDRARKQIEQIRDQVLASATTRR